MDNAKAKTDEKIEDIIDDLWATMGQKPPEYGIGSSSSAPTDDEDPYSYYESLSRDDENNAAKELEDSRTATETVTSETNKSSSNIETPASLEEEAPAPETVTSETNMSSSNTETPASLEQEASASETVTSETNKSPSDTETPASLEQEAPALETVTSETNKSPSNTETLASLEQEAPAPETDTSETNKSLGNTETPAQLPLEEPTGTHSSLNVSATAGSAENPEPAEAAVPPDPARPEAAPVVAPEAIEGARYDAPMSRALIPRGQVPLRRVARPRVPMLRVPLGAPTRANGLPRNHEGWQLNENIPTRSGSRHYATYPPIHYSNVVHYPPGRNIETRGSNRRRERSRYRVRYGPYY